MKGKISCIVCAYNEEKTIEKVLDVISKCELIDDLIVIDDCSKDNTKKIVKKYDKIKLIVNEKNMGKAHSMNLGVENSKNDLIFFCDADIRGLTAEMIKEAKSKINGTDMFILGRNRFAYLVLVPIGLKLGFVMLSGERIIKKELWYKMKRFYKYRYRVETGLNYTSKFFGKNFKVGVFGIKNTAKEVKYSFLKGLWLRKGLMWDILLAFLFANFIDRFNSLRTKA